MRPEHAWDRRRMLALASGLVAHYMGAVGGPIAANRSGKAVAPGAVVQQRLHPRFETIEAMLSTREPTLTCCSVGLVDAGHHHAPLASPRSATGRRCPLATDDAPPLDRLLDAVHTLAPLIRAYAEEAEQHRRLPQPVVTALAVAGLFRLYTPHTLGGWEV